MNGSEREREEVRVFSAALEFASALERAAYLEEACRGDETLRKRVEALLQVQAEADEFFSAARASGSSPGEVTSSPTASSARGAAAVRVAERPGDRIGRYKLREKIGEGGCGVVYVAEQEGPVRRRVALKVIKAGMDTRNVIARFEAERQALAMMDHPNIAKVFDAGATDTGRPYFVMELVRGVKITEYCDQNHLDTRERLDLFVKVCQAVQHAHQKGIIHRDIKPSNILVTLHDGAPVPKVIDFGIAKATEGRLTDLTVYTELHQFIGTPAYMSPEQAEMSGLDIDTRSDIYSLGVLLYELLTGKTPFDAKELLAAGLEEMRRTIREKEPLRPSTRLRTMLEGERTTTAKNRHTEAPKLASLLRGDLDWIVMKCLEKDRTRRYETTNGLSADLQRHLNNEAVVARPPTAAYRIGKFVRRNKVIVTAVATLATVLVLGIFGTTWQAVRATHLRHVAEEAQKNAKAQAARADQSAASATLSAQRADQERNTARHNAYAANMLLAQADWDTDNVAHVRQILGETRSEPDRGFEWYYWQRQCHLELRTLYGHLSGVTQVAFSQDGQRVVTASYDGTTKIWDAYSGRELLTLNCAGPIDTVAISPDGKRIVTGQGSGDAKLWETSTGHLLFRLRGHTTVVRSATFSPDGKRILTLSADGTGILWDTSTGRLSFSFREQDPGLNWCTTGTFSPDGRRIILGKSDGTAKVRDAATRAELLELSSTNAGVSCVASSADGQRIAVAHWNNRVTIWSAETGRELLMVAGYPLKPSRHGKHPNVGIAAVAFSPRGEWLATGGEDRLVGIWDANTGVAWRAFKGHTDAIESVSISPDGQRIVSGSEDGTAKIWQASAEQDLLMLDTNAAEIVSVSFSWDGQRIVVGRTNATIGVFDSAGALVSPTLTGDLGSIRAVAVSPDGQRIASGSEDNTARIWDLNLGHEPRRLIGHKGWVRALAFSSDGRLLATASNDRTAWLWDSATGQEVRRFIGHTGIVFSVAFAPQGERLVTGSGDGKAKVWDTRSGQELRTLTGHVAAVTAVVFSPDGKRVATGSQDHTAKLWEPATGRELVSFRGHAGTILSLAFSPDGRRLATAAEDGTAKVWDASTGQDLLTLRGQTGVILAIAFSADGRRILTGSSDGTVRLWTAASDEQVAAGQNEQRLGEERLAEATQKRERERSGDERVLRHWLILGPIPLPKIEGVHTELWKRELDRQQIPDEAALRPAAEESVSIGGQELFWNEEHLTSDVLDFNEIFGDQRDFSVAYAVCYLASDREQTQLRIVLGSDDQEKLYLNGRQIHKRDLPRSFAADSDEIDGIELHRGTNVLVFKVLNTIADWQGSVRLMDKEGNPLKGVKALVNP